MKLALGTVQFGLDYGIANNAGKVMHDEASAILADAAAAGLDTLDTAIAYGDSELALGRIGVAGWSVVSKLPGLPDDVADVRGWALDQVRGSLRRLGVERLHAVLLHRPDQLFGARGAALLDALAALKAEGLAGKTGVSVYAPDELERLFALATFDVVQAPLSILDTRLVDSGWARRLRGLGVELHTRSAFLQGLLLMPDGVRPEKFNRWSAVFEAWSAWLRQTGLSPLAACLRYPMSIAEVDKVVVGIDSVAQLREILAAADGPLAMLPRWPEAVDADLLNPANWSKL